MAAYTAAQVAFTAPNEQNEYQGDKRVRRGTLTLPGSYTNPGGDAYTPDIFGLKSIARLELDSVCDDGSRLVVVDPVNSKIKAYSALGTEVVNAVNLGARTVTFEVIGT